MADLQVCYFCGSGPDSPLGEYAVVPPALNPTDGQQRSVVLCPDCREKLTTVMEPVVEAVGTHAGAGGPGPGGETAGADAGGEAAGADAGGEAAGADAGRETAGAGDQVDTAADDPAAGTGSTGDPAVGGSTDGDPPSGPGVSDDSAGDAPSAGGASSDEPAAGAGDDVAVPPREGGESDDDVSIDSGSRADEPSSGGSSAPLDAGGDDEGVGRGGGPPAESNAPRDHPHADDEFVGRNNEAYNKTLRLLQNREFPVERHEIEQIAASAYQLDPQEVSNAIDALIRKGLLTQEGAQLRRP